MAQLFRSRVAYARRVRRGVGEVEGWAAVAWVAGLGVVMLLSAGVLFWRARSLRDQPATPATYRSAGTPGSDRASHVRGLAIVLVAVCVLSQLLYVGLYVELAQWLIGANERPRMTADLFFWVFLVDMTCVGGALYTGLRNTSR